MSAHLSDLWTAFSELSTERSSGMGVGPIPISKIEHYVGHHMGLDGDDADLAIAILRATDVGYLEIVHADKGDGDGKRPATVKADDATGVLGLLDRMKKRVSPTATKETP